MRKQLTKLKEAFGKRSGAAASAAFPLAIGLICYQLSDRWVERDASKRFAGHALNAKTNLDSRIKSYSDLLRAVSSLFRVNATVSPEALRSYVDGLQLGRQFPAVLAINYAEYVLDADRFALEQRLIASYGAALPLRSAMLIRARPRHPEYEIVSLAHSEQANLYGLAFNLRDNPEYAALLDLSRDSGTMGAAGTPIPVAGDANDRAFGLRQPLYQLSRPLSSPEQRRAAYRGSVGIIFSFKRLVRDVLADVPVHDLRMTVVDATPGTPGPQSRPVPGGELLFDSRTGVVANAPSADHYFSTVEAISFHGRRWNVTFSVPKRSFYTASETYFPALAAGAGAITAFLLYALFNAQTSSMRRAMALAHAMTLDLRRLAARASQVRESERQRIAREIHDDLGQNLLALRIEADVLTERTRRRHPRLHARAAQTRDQIDTTIKSVRQIINDLRPAVLDLGLAAALEWQVAEFTRRSGIACHLVGHTGIELDDQHATAFFRILQESLSNVLRHARASSVHVAVSATPGALAMTISDDGVGLPEDAGRTRGSFGLLGIEERVTMLGGTFSFRGAPGQGTTISVSIPLATHGGPANHTPPPGERAASPERRARTSSGQASRPCRE